MGRILSLILLTTIISCSLLPPRRQYIKTVKQQRIPIEILSTSWTLESFGNKVPDCSITMTFLEKGQLTLGFKNELFQGDNLWYIVKDSTIEFHTRPLEKLAWTSDNCEMNPSIFALYIHGSKTIKIESSKLTFIAFDNSEFVFSKV